MILGSPEGLYTLFPPGRGPQRARTKPLSGVERARSSLTGRILAPLLADRPPVETLPGGFVGRQLAVEPLLGNPVVATHRAV